MNDFRTDYNTYKFTTKELIRYGLTGYVYFFLMGMIFFQNIWLSLMAGAGVLLYLREVREACIRKRKERLLSQFREAMYALSSSLSAGRSVEQAFVQSLGDLKIIFGQKDDIVLEWQMIVDRLGMNETIEVVLEDFAGRAGVEDIHNFVSVFVMAKRSGGDLLRIIKDTTHMINEKIEIQKEIDVLITQKKFEQKILSYIIPGMILFFTVTSPNFLTPLYTTVNGRMIMATALGLYIISARLGKKIVAIEV